MSAFRNISSLLLCRPVVTRAVIRYKSKHKGCNTKKYARKSETYMNKLTRDSDVGKKKRKWFNSNQGTHVQTPWFSGSGMASLGSQRRANQLSVYLLEHVCNVFYHGEVCPELNEYSFEIDRVIMALDFNNLNIYWNATGNDKIDNRIEEMLEMSKGHLRSVLTQKNLLGRIPPITFIKDSLTARIQVVENLLKRADMGPEHQPTELGHNLKSEPRLPKWTGKKREDQLGQGDQRDEQSELGYSYVEGPGGTREVVFSDAKSCAAESSTNTSDTIKGNSARDNTAEKLSGNSHGSDDLAQQEPNHLSRLHTKCNIYDLDHSKLYQEVLQLKRISKDRNFKLPKVADSHNHDDKFSRQRTIDSANISKFLAKRRGKERATRDKYSQTNKEQSLLRCSDSAEDGDVFVDETNFYDDDIHENDDIEDYYDNK